MGEKKKLNETALFSLGLETVSSSFEIPCCHYAEYAIRALIILENMNAWPCPSIFPETHETDLR